MHCKIVLECISKALWKSEGKSAGINFWTFQLLDSKTFGFFGLWDFWTLGLLNLGTFGLWDFGTLELLDFGTSGLWDFGIF